MLFKLEIGKAINWPNKCAYCGGTASSFHTVSGKSYSGYSFKVIYHEIKFDKLSISFPVCKKHKLISCFLPPVGVMEVGHHYYTIMIQNPLYAFEFAELNGCGDDNI